MFWRRVTVRVRGRPSDRLSRGAAGIQAEDVYVATTRAGRKSDPRYPDLADTTTSSENRTDSREGPKTLPKTSYVATARAREDCCRFVRALFRGPSSNDANPSGVCGAQANGRLRGLATGGGHCMCKKSTPLQFIPNLKYLFKVSMTVTYSQRQEYPHFVGASLSLPSRSALGVHVY